MHITLANLHLATPQQVFDQVARHLLTQKVRSVDIMGNCKYRGPNGLKCAAGCVISDDEYYPSFEGKSWDLVCMTRAQDGRSIVNELIGRLQLVHDSFAESHWRAKLQIVADDFKLDGAVLDT